MNGTPRVRVRGLTKVYRTRRGDVRALDNVSLDVDEGELLVLLGPSGCGKTTLLRCVAGLERPDAGEIEVQGRVVFSSTSHTWIPPEGRELSMVFQSYALWPHMSVYANVAYPLENAKVAPSEVRTRVEEGLRLVGLEAYAAAYPGHLSGGQQQRVALARALVANRSLVLFDEPLSNLDAKVRERLRLDLLTLHQRFRFSSLYVTHDQTEASALGDRIAVMSTGRIDQIGTSLDIYERPASRYVANFIGTANELPGRVVEASDGMARVATGIGELIVRGSRPVPAPTSDVVVLFRPEHCRLGEEVGASNENLIRGRVARSVFLGSYVEYITTVGETSLVLRRMGGPLLTEGTELAFAPDARRVLVFAR